MPRGAHTPEKAQKQPRRRRRWGRRLLIGGGVLVLLLAVVVLAAPLVAAAYAPSALERGLNRSIQGTADVGDVSLSWWGGQQVGPVIIRDRDGNIVANLNLELRRGLWGLARSAVGMAALDLGRAELKGGITIVRYADGSTNLERIFQQQVRGPKDPQAPAPPERTRVPPSLSGSFAITGLNVRFVDEAKLRDAAPASVVNLPNLAGELAIADGASITARLTSDLNYAASLDGGAIPGGNFSLIGSLLQFTDGDGYIVPEQAVLDAHIQGQDIALAIADTLADMDSALASGLGERLQADIRASGSLNSAQGRLRIATAGAEADAAVELRDGILTMPRPALVQASSAAVRALAPGLAGLENSERIEVEAYPDVRLTVDDLRVKVPTGGAALDLRGARLRASLSTTEARGQVLVPDGEGGAGSRQEFSIAPIAATIVTQDLAQRVNIQARTSAVLGGQPAGQINVDVAAIDPLNAEGGLRTGIPGRLEGIIEIDSLATAIADPLVDQLGLDLANDVGPVLNIAVRASTAQVPAAAGTAQAGAAQAGAAPTGAATMPPTDLSINIDSANVQARAQVAYDSQVIRAGQDAVQVRMQQPAPLLNRALGAPQVSVESAGPVTISASNVVIDLERMRALGGTDLRALAGLVSIETGPAAGTLALADRPPQQWTLEPVTASINAARATRGVTVRARTAAMLDGQPAGMVNIDMVASDLFDAQGQISPAPQINGRAVVQRIATSAMQPWAEAAGIDLPAGIGPHIDLAVTARSREGAGAGQTGPGAQAAGRSTELDVTIRAQQLTGDALLTIADGALVSRGEGVQLVARRPASLLGPAAQNAGVQIAQAGEIRLSGRDIRIPFAVEQPMRHAAARVEVQTGGFVVRPPAAAPAAGEPPAPAAQPITLEQMAILAQLTPEQAPSVQLQGGGSHQGAQFSMQGQLQLPGVLEGETVRPLGTIELRNVPTTLAALVPGVGGGGPWAPGQLLRDVAGQSVTLVFTAERPQGAAAEARALSMEIDSPGLSGQAGGRLTETEFALQNLDLRARISPPLAQRLFAAMGPQLVEAPQIDGPAMLQVSATPFTLPLQGMRPELQRAGNAVFRVGLEGTTTIRRIMVAQEEGPPRDLGPMGLRDLLIQAEVPVASLAPGGQAAPATARLSGDVLGPEGAPFVNLQGQARMMLANAAPQGSLSGQVALNITDTQRIDALLEQQGLLADGLGPQARVSLQLSAAFADPAQGGGFTPQRTIVRASIDSPKLRTAEALHLEMLPDRFVLGQPAQLNWRMEPSWANWYLLQAGAVQPGEAEQIRFTTAADIRISLRQLAIARGEGVGPMAPGIFQLQADVNTPGAAMSIDGVRANFTEMQAQLTGGREPGEVSFALRVQDAGGGPGPGGEPAVNLAGAINSLADQRGNITVNMALLTAKGLATGIPTPLADAIARQDGLLIEALGPVCNVQVDVRSLSVMEGEFVGGNVNLLFNSSRAEARVAGTIHEGTLITQGQTTATLREVTPELGARLFKGVPLIGSFEKGSQQAPATVTVTNLTLPLDGNLAHLNGDFVLDPGEATFATSNIFGRLLKIAGQPGAGEVGRRVNSFRATVRNGSASYERFTLPLGEFTVDTSGSFDLVNRRLDVVTYVPFGALTDEAAGMLSTGIGRLLGGAIPTIEKATMVPIRTRGTFDSPSTAPDMELFVQQAGRTLLRPDQLIGGTIQDIFDRLNPRPRNGNSPPAPGNAPGESPPANPPQDPAPAPGGGGSGGGGAGGNGGR